LELPLTGPQLPGGAHPLADPAAITTRSGTGAGPGNRDLARAGPVRPGRPLVGRV